MKNYTTPKFEISRFKTENIITTSGEVTTKTLQQRMEDDGHTVTVVNLLEADITL